MKVWVDKKEWEWFQTMQNELRTRNLRISTFPNLTTDIELKIKEKDKELFK